MVTQNEKDDYLAIFKKQWQPNQKEMFERELRAFFDKYPHLVRFPDHISEEEKAKNYEEKREYDAQKLKTMKFNAHVKSKQPHFILPRPKNSKPKPPQLKPEREIPPQLRDWKYGYPLPPGYQTIDSKTFTCLTTGDQIRLTQRKAKRSKYREYLMTHKSLRDEQYPNGPPHDDRDPKLHWEWIDPTKPA